MPEPCRGALWKLWSDGHDWQAVDGRPEHGRARCKRCNLLRIGLWPGAYTYEEPVDA